MALPRVISALSSHALSGAPHVACLATRCRLERSEGSAFKQIPHFVRDDTAGDETAGDDTAGADAIGDAIVRDDMLGTTPDSLFAKTPPALPSADGLVAHRHGKGA